MKRMWSLNQLRNIADAQAKAVQKDITTLVDKDGHPRFIEGDIEMDAIEGVDLIFGKWSLSGSHLLIVASHTFANGTALNYSALGKLKDLPKWISDKIAILFSTNIVEQKNAVAYNNVGSTQTYTYRLYKDSEGNISFGLSGTITFSDDRTDRIAFDLLIDND